MSKPEIDPQSERQTELYILEMLSDSINPEGERKRVKKSDFKILNAIYLRTKKSEQLGHKYVSPSFELIAKMSKCSRRLVSEFVNSSKFSIFCEVKKDKWKSHVYVLKEWVYQWFRLFWRSGMMKYLHTKYDWWKSTFKKRLNNWLIPLVQQGKTVREIYDSVVNNLSTGKCPKVNARKGLKGATIKPPEEHEAFGTKTNYENPDVVVEEFQGIVGILRDRLCLRDGDIRHFMFKNCPEMVGRAAKRLSSWGRIDHPERAMQFMINKLKKERQYAR